jgi:hypothetical protein
MTNKYVGRKFIAFLLMLTTVIFLSCMSFIEGGTIATVLLGVYGIYAGAKTIEHKVRGEE